jgi:lipopolysaccharide transport system ATP-binding protein
MMPDYSNLPTVFHITHWKAGSQWIYAILRTVADEQRIITPKIKMAHFLEDPIIPGMIYPTVYVHRQRFESVSVPENHIKFLVIRDLRDSSVSNYFSLKVSHPVISDVVAKGRSELAETDTETGLLHVVSTMMRPTALIQSSWLGTGILTIRYEDLITDEYNQFKKIVDHCQIKIDDSQLKNIVETNSFEAQTGRRKGEEDIQSHFRKGIVGDWRNYFTDEIKDKFKELYGDLLIQTGYEKDYSW